MTRRPLIGVVTRRRPGYRPHRMRTHRRWPLHSLEVGDVYTLAIPRFFHTVTQCAYQLGKRTGRKFSVLTVEVDGGRVLRVTRTA